MIGVYVGKAPLESFFLKMVFVMSPFALCSCAAAGSNEFEYYTLRSCTEACQRNTVSCDAEIVDDRNFIVSLLGRLQRSSCPRSRPYKEQNLIVASCSTGQTKAMKVKSIEKVNR